MDLLSDGIMIGAGSAIDLSLDFLWQSGRCLPTFRKDSPRLQT